MTDSELEWLPPLICLEDHGGNWQRYLEALYSRFRRDFVYSRPTFRDMVCGARCHPKKQEMEAGFWHLISDGLVEDERLPDLRRCERIAWPRPMIEADGTEQVNVWLSRGEAWKRGSRVAIALRDFSYVAILEYAGNHMLLVTAYLVEHDHRREKLRRQFEADKKMTPPLGGDVSTPSTAW